MDHAFVKYILVWRCLADQILPEVESQFNHRKVNFKRSKDVRAVYQMIDEIGR